MVKAVARAQSLESTIRRLDEGASTQLLDAVLDELFSVAEEQGNVGCTALDNDVLSIQQNGESVCEPKLLHARAKLRLLSARLATLCSAWLNHQVKPYGDDVVVVRPGSHQACRVRFDNTPDLQRITIEEATQKSETIGHA